MIKLLSARLCQGSIADAISTLTKLLLKVLSCPVSIFSLEVPIRKSQSSVIKFSLVLRTESEANVKYFFRVDLLWSILEGYVIMFL